MLVGIPKEIFPGENRIAVIPSGIQFLTDAGCALTLFPKWIFKDSQRHAQSSPQRHLAQTTQRLHAREAGIDSRLF